MSASFWIALVGTPLLAAFAGLAVWFVQSRLEETRRARERLRDERRDIYKAILAPYILSMSGVRDQKTANKAIEMVTSVEYKKSAYDFVLVAPDDVVRAFNRMTSYIYSVESSGPDVKTLVGHWADFLLELRRSVGDPTTKLSAVEMVESMFKDIRNYLGT